MASVVLVAALVCAGILIALDPWSLRVPSWCVWHTQVFAADLESDGSEQTVSLAKRAVTVRAANGSVLYQSPDDWRICDVVAADVTRDGKPELLMLVWRRGNYGSSRPFWDTGVDLRMTEHLYVLGMRDGVIVPVWMGHELGRSVTKLLVSDDGTVTLGELDGSQTSWVWEGFGFVAA